ncbi:MAG: YggS family pyridoxal phosphate-dependent enzyme [Rhodospirillales bacterium]|nr:YggS family pyridoxal phosphate-dependent enzyme [Rhodospirillales bacterium]
MATSSEISENLKTVSETIQMAAEKAGRSPLDVTLVAVSKTHPPETVRQALEAGHRIFGENKVQEAEDKWPALKAQYPDAKVHLIGPLQSNKTKRAVQVFDVIETVDRIKLARALAREFDLQAKRPDCYIQINTGEEAQKAGILPTEADAFIAQCRDHLHLPVVGLMCIPPADENPALHFALLSEIAKRNGLQKLSMGMSGDYPVAVEFGATSVRVGTAIFGSRALVTDRGA